MKIVFWSSILLALGTFIGWYCMLAPLFSIILIICTIFFMYVGIGMTNPNTLVLALEEYGSSFAAGSCFY